MGNLDTKVVWFNKMSGKDNQGNLERFVDIEKTAKSVTGLNKDENNALLVAASYKIGKYSVGLENLYVKDYTNTFEQKANASFDLGKKVNVAEQFLVYSSKNDSIDSKVFGLKAGVGLTPNIYLSVAYNNVGDTKVVRTFGGDPLFTSMTFANAYGDSNVDAVKLTGTYSVDTKHTLSLNAGKYKGDNKDTKAVDLSASCEMYKGQTISTVLGYTNTKKDPNNYNVRVTYHYSF